MEFYKKIKQKIEDELIQDEDEDDDEEEEPPNGSIDEGENTNEYRSSRAENKQLRKEIATLKEHINRNYDVYVKRLEKRKAKIKEHEDNIKIVLSENEKLSLKLKESEGYAEQLSECRESLEQLEGFQNQELAKVKHMLLSAETALELEKQERLRLRDQLEELKKVRHPTDLLLSENTFKHNQDASTNTLNPDEASNNETELSKDTELQNQNLRIQELRDEHEVVVNDLKNTISLLQAKVQNSSSDSKDSKSSQEHGEPDTNEISIIETENKQLLRQSNDLKERIESMKQEHERTVKELEHHNSELKAKLKSVGNERDNAKSSLLELEIAKHECEEGLAKQDSDSKMKLVQLTTEKETLEVTLELREQELKSRKEELRQEKERFKQELRDMEELSNARGMQNSALQAELGSVKTQLLESNDSLHRVQNTLQTLHIETGKLNKDLASKQAIISNIEVNLEQTNSKYEELNCDFESLVTMNDKLEKENSDLQANISTLQSKCENLNNSKEELELKCDKINNEVEILQNTISESERTFPDRLENSNLVRSLKNQIVKLEDEVGEKKQSAKLLQQRLNDMKKTFQKELKTTSGKGANASHENGTDDNSSIQIDPYDNINHSQSNMDDRKTPIEFFAGSSSAISPFSSSKGPTSNNLSGIGAMEEELGNSVDLQYLKHVIFKFLTSKEYEAKQLTRAIATLLKFTKDEERLLTDHLDWKSSWFGSKPDLGKGQFSRSIDHI